MRKERRAEHSNPCPRPAGDAVLEAAQDAVAPPGCQGPCLNHVQLAIDPNPQIALCRAALQPLVPPTLRSARVAPCQAWSASLALAKPHLVGDCPAL